ncbi:MAG: HlyD family efflux transporter periplasmic adaptor subunit [Anaerolineae bacterium]
MRRLSLMLVRAGLLVAGLLSGCLLTGCMPGATPVPPPTPTFWPTAVVPEKPTYTVERGIVVDSLTFTGRVAPVREEELYFRADGRVLEVYGTRGQSVQTDDLLAELDVEALHRQLARAALDLETAKTELASAALDLDHDLARAQTNLELEQIALHKLESYDSRVDLAVVEAELEQATINLQNAQADYDAVSHLANIAMRPEAEALQQATLAHARAQAAYDQAVRQRSQRTFDIQSQQKRVALAQLEVERLAAGVDPRLEQAVAKAELELSDLQAQITDTLILAPFDGEISAVSTAAGKAVTGFEPVIVIADPTDLEVSAELSADEMRKLSEGQEATVVPIEYPGQELPGTIRSLPYPYGSGGGTTGVDEEDQSTRLSVDLQGVQVKPGDLVRVRVILEQKDDVLWLPPAAIRTFEGRKFVLVQEGAGQRQVDVTLGIESDERVEIEAGLQEGQVVIGP